MGRMAVSLRAQRPHLASGVPCSRELLYLGAQGQAGPSQAELETHVSPKLSRAEVCTHCQARHAGSLQEVRRPPARLGLLSCGFSESPRGSRLFV